MANTDRFAFGENWRQFATTLDAERIDQAEASLRAFLRADNLRGSRFLDIGCGSGLFSLAALNLGAREVMAVDFDPNSVATTRLVLERYAASKVWQCRQDDIFEMSMDNYGTFDIVYSWGVLHHTGDMFRAIDCAANFVRPGGHFLIALYGKTPFCKFWQWEKRNFVAHPRWFPFLARTLYKALLILGLLASGRNPLLYIKSYRTLRGMNWNHDVEDWLGGYPYESIEPSATICFVEERGFQHVQSKTENRFGLFGSGCDEFLFRRTR